MAVNDFSLLLLYYHLQNIYIMLLLFYVIKFLLCSLSTPSGSVVGSSSRTSRSSSFRYWSSLSPPSSRTASQTW